jgi:hypothetical protein
MDGNFIKSRSRVGVSGIKKMKRNSKGGWLLYIMLHVPNVIAWKVGITHTSIGAKGRAKSIDKAVIGFPFPIFFCVLPGAYHLEQWLHRRMSFFKWRFYRGDGSSEWFFFAGPLLIALPIMLFVWAIEIWLLSWAVEYLF